MGSCISGTVLVVQEVLDGTAKTMIIELDKQLSKLRNTAHDLNIPNFDAINWTLIVSSTSDETSTQFKFTKLFQDYSKRDEEINWVKEVWK